MSTLYVVATPIGNLRDITLRGLEVLREVDCIICESPFVTKKLLARHEIAARRLLKHTEHQTGRTEAILKGLRGQKIALVVNAGTPGISDPGAEIVKSARELGFSVVSIPGPSAPTAALSISGIRASHFTFLGFLPKKRGALIKALEDLKKRGAVGVSYESPHRILKTLKVVEGEYPNLNIFCAKELTKIYEESRWGSAAELLQWLAEPQKTRGEFVLIFDCSSYGE